MIIYFYRTDVPLEVSTIKSCWKKGINAGGSRNDPEKFSLNPQYLLHLKESCWSKEGNECSSVLVGLMQEHRRSEKNKRLAMIPIGFFIYKVREYNQSKVQKL